MRDELGIVIVNYNNGNVLFSCINSLQKTRYTSNVVVVDNGSQDGSLEKLQKRKDKLGIAKIIKNRRNLGFAGGNNVGIKYFLKKGKKYILILNPDTEVTKGSVENLYKALETDKKTGIAGPKIYDESGKIWSCGGELDKKRFSGRLIGYAEEDKGNYGKRISVDFISGTAMLVKKEVFESVGFFYDKYFIYYEDVELCLRASKNVFDIKFIPEAVIYHKESSSFGKESPFHKYYLARNHLLFVERNAPLAVVFREFARLPKTIYEHIKKKERWAVIGILDYLLRRFGKSDYFS